MVLTEKRKTRAEGLYWIWQSKALIKHELVSLLPYMYCSVSCLPPLTVSHSLPCIFCKSRPGVFTAPPKWQNDWVMYECNSACCDVSYIMWEVRRCSRFHVCCKPTDGETLEMHCARWDVSTAVKTNKKMSCLQAWDMLAWDAITAGTQIKRSVGCFFFCF